MKYFFLLILLIPSLLFSLNEKECRKYFQNSQQNYQAASVILKQLANQSIEEKINLMNQAIQNLHEGIFSLDIILNHIRGLKSHKLREWHHTVKNQCKMQKTIFVDSLNHLQKRLVILEKNRVFKLKQQEANQTIDAINQRNVEITSLATQPNIDDLNKTHAAIAHSIMLFEQILNEIALIHDLDIKSHLAEWAQCAEMMIKKHRQSMNEVEKNQNFLIALESAKKLDALGNLKYEEASKIAHTRHPSKLSELPSFNENFSQVSALYQEALENYQQALNMLTPHKLETSLTPIENKILHLEELIHEGNLSSSFNFRGEDQKIKLEEHLILLEGLQATLGMKKKMEAILEELADFGEENRQKLDHVRKEILELETKEKEEIPVSKPFLSDEAFCQKEEEKIEVFFSQQPLARIEDKLINTSSLGQSEASSYPDVTPLDIQFLANENTYELYLDQFYHFLVRYHLPLSYIRVDVIQDSEIVYQENIQVSDPSQGSWIDFVLEDGFVSIPKTILTTNFGLSLHLMAVAAKDQDHALVIKHKAENPQYQFAFSCEHAPLYQCSFIAPPPWQLEVLRRAVMPLCPPLDKLPPTFKDPINSVNEVSIELSPHPLLDAFVDEMKNDPLALARYVYNEIEFLDPFLLEENSVLIPPKIQRDALNTFLEKQGGPWDQCALLVYLLRKAGYQAIYAQGADLFLPTKYLERLLGKELPDKKETLIRYPWVLFFDGHEWITLFPWMKDIKFEEGHNLYNFLPEDYSSGEKWIKKYLTNDPPIFELVGADGDDTAGVLFVRFLENELKKQGLSRQDVGIHRSINKKHFVSWQDFPRVEIRGAFQKASSLNAFFGLLSAVKIEISSRENPQKRIEFPWNFLPALCTYPPTIHFEPTNNNHHALCFSQSCEQIIRKIDLDSSDQHIEIKISLIGQGDDSTKTFCIAKGTCAALCFNVGGACSKKISLFGDRFSEAKEERSKLHTLLALIGALYFDKCHRAERDLAYLHKLNPSTILHFGLVKLSPDLSQGPLEGVPNLVFPQVDMHKFTFDKESASPFSYHQSISLAKRQFDALNCCDSSSNEHQVLREIFNDPYAISTVKLLQIAHNEHQNKGLTGTGFLTFTQKSFADAEKHPIFSQCFHFNHLKGLNLSQVKSQAGAQWNTASFFLQNQGKRAFDQNFSYVFMTPGPVSSLDGNDVHLPSYRGMGTLIIHNQGSCALISNGTSVMNGGYGSRLPSHTIPSIVQNDWKLIQSNHHYSFLSSQDFPTFQMSKSKNGIQEAFTEYHSSPIVPSQFDLTVKSSYKDFRYAPNDPFILSLSTRVKSDVRSGFKSIYDTVADPVDVVSGAFYIDEVDLDLPGVFPLEIRRNYSNQHPINGPLGIGWKMSLNPFLVEEGDHLFAAEKDGTVIDYRFCEEHARWEVFSEDNPELRNYNQSGIGGTSNPYHAYIDLDFRLHSADGSIRKFENKLLKEWTDGSGNSLFFIYQQNRLMRIENSDGGYLGFSYNHKEKIAEAYTKDGRRVYYHYDEQDHLIKVEHPNGAITSYEYDLSHQIIKELKPHGKAIENHYDEHGRVIEQFSPNGVQQQMVLTAKFTYEDGITTVTDAAGASSEYKIYQKNIYKITDPAGNKILHSHFITANTWFDAETEQVISWNQPGGYARSLKSSKDQRGLVTDYLYDDRGNPVEVTMSGKDLTGQGDQSLVKKLCYNKDNLCVLEQVVDNKTITVYDKDHPHLPKRIETYCCDQLSKYIDLQYNAKGQVVVEDRSGAITSWEYDSRGFPLKKIRRTGTEDPDVLEIFDFNEQGRCIEHTTSDAVIQYDYDITGNPYRSSIYDRSGNLISTQYTGYDLNQAPIWHMGLDPHDVTSIDYNLAGQPKAIRKSLSKALIGENNTLQIMDAGVAYTLFDYDARGHLIKEVNSLGHAIYREYDLLGRQAKVSNRNNTTQFAYEPGGLIAEILSNELKTTRDYYQNGLLAKETYPDGTEAIFTYDLFERIVTETKDGITLKTEYDDAQKRVVHRAQQKIIKIEEFDAQGNLISMIDTQGNTWKKTYDALGRIKTDTDPEGNQTTWHYQEASVTCILPSNEKLITHYQAGKVIESQTLTPEGIPSSHTQCEYCALTNSVKTLSGAISTRTWMNTQGAPIAVKQGELLTLYQYDPSGNCIATSTGEGKTVYKQYDPLGRLIKKTLTGGGIVTYAYDAQSNLTRCDLPGGISWLAEYDSVGRKVLEELQAGGTISQAWKYRYENGRLKEALDPQLRQHLYFYDDLGRVIEELVGLYSRRYTYDERGLLISIEQQGQDDTKVERQYDANRRLTSETVFLNSQLLNETLQSWEPRKRTLQIGNHKRQFEYLSGRLTSLTTPDISLKYSYDISGSLLNRSTNHLHISYDYDSSGMPTTMTSQILTERYQEKLTWNKHAKMASYKSHWRQIEAEKLFSYNMQGQLESINDDEYAFDFNTPGCGVRTLSPNWIVPREGLDPFGKIISEISENKEVHTLYNSSGQVSSRTFENQEQQFTWDPWGNLIEISTETYVWSAAYDPFGRRLKTCYQPKEGKTHTTLSFYDPEKEFEEIGVSNEGKLFWKFFTDNHCDAIVDDEGNAVSLLYNALGALTAVVEAGQIHWSNQEVSPYGPRSPPSFPESSLISFALAHSWQSRQVDPTGYLWMGARYYDPIGGKFLSPDPIGIPLSLDLYAYANGDPINFNDPDGRFASAIYAPISASKGFWGVVGSIVQLPGVALSHISHELIPIPIVKDVLEFGGWCLQGKHPASYNWRKNHSQLVIHQGNGHGDPHFRHLSYFGVGVSLDDCKERLAKYSEQNGGVTVYGIYNGAYGFAIDGIEVICQKLGVPVHAQRIAERETRNILNSMGDCKTHGFLITNAHSQGAETVYNLSSDLKKRMDVKAFAPARILQEGDFNQANNYLAPFDPVPLLDPIGLIKGRRNGNVHYVETSGCPFVDHCYENNGFKKVREQAGSLFTKHYGVTQ